MKILAMKWRRLGDTILWTSALQALQQAFPGARIDLAYPFLYRALFQEDPRWGKQFLFRGSRSWDQWDSIRQWRSERYDWVLNFHASSRSLMISLFSGAKNRLVHHHSRKPKNFFSHRRIVQLGVPMAAVERDLNVVRTLGWQGKASAPRLILSDSLREAAQKKLQGAGWHRGDPLFVLSPEASRLAKQWPCDSYVSLAQRLKRHGFVVIVESTKGRFSPSKCDGDLSVIVTPQLEDLMGILSLASVWVGSDSGAKHMACALGVKTVTLFGPESIGEWHFYPETDHRVIQRAVQCRDRDPTPSAFAWCGAEVCPLGSHACLQLILPEAVSKEVFRVLR